MVISKASFDGPNYLYTSKHNYMDFSIDDNGLWVIYSTPFSNNTNVAKVCMCWGALRFAPFTGVILCTIVSSSSSLYPARHGNIAGPIQLEYQYQPSQGIISGDLYTSLFSYIKHSLPICISIPIHSIYFMQFSMVLLSRWAKCLSCAACCMPSIR